MANVKKAARAAKVAKAGKAAGSSKATKPVKAATAPQAAKPAQVAKQDQAAKPTQVAKPAQAAKALQATEAAQAAPAVQSPQTVQTSVPVGLKVIALGYYLGTLLQVLLASSQNITYAAQIPIVGPFGTGLFVVGGLLIYGSYVGFLILMFGLAVLYFFVGRGLWKARNWARIVAIIFSVSGIIFTLTSYGGANLTVNLISLLLNLGIGGYLLFSRDVKRAVATPVQSPQTTQTSVPVWVKIIAVLYCIDAVLSVLFGLTSTLPKTSVIRSIPLGAISSGLWYLPHLPMSMTGEAISSLLFYVIPRGSALRTGLFVVLGIVSIVLGVLGFFIGRGLWKARNWARIAAIILTGIGVVSIVTTILPWLKLVSFLFLFGQANIASNIAILLLNLGIGGYLLFSSDVKRAFA